MFNVNPYNFSIKDIRVRRAGTVVQFPAAMQFNVSPMVVAGMLRGSSKIVAANSYIEGAEAAFGVGGLPIAAMPVILGMTLPAPTGSTPNRVQTFDVAASQALPYFELIGRTEDGDGGDMHVYVPRCKVMSNFQIQMQDGANFVAPQMTVNCVPDDSGLPFRIITHETTTPIAFPDLTTIALTDVDVASNIATATSASAHGLQPGQLVTISGTAAEYANGLKQVITAPSSTTFTYVAIGANVSNLTGSVIIAD